MSSDILLSVMTLLDYGGVDFMGADYFRLPEGVDRDTLTALILSETAEQEVVYPEPQTMATVVRAWSTARLDAWTRMLAALTEQYNPLHNYDRTETETAEEGEDETEATAETETEDTDDTTQSGTTVTEKVTGYNSNTFNDNTQNVGQGNVSGSRDRETTRDKAVTRSLGRDKSRTLRAFGNIGVTTSAEMLAGEMEVRQTDIYTIIADEFERYFCIGIY